MRRILTVVFVLTATLAQAQTPAVPTDRLVWSQAAASLSEAQSYTYTLILDSVRQATPLGSVTCTGAASPFTCEVPFPAMTPGQHSVQLVASLTVPSTPPVQLDSEASVPFSVRLYVAPLSPAGLTIRRSGS